MSREYPSIRHSKKFKSSSSIYISREDLFRTTGSGRVDVGPSTTHLSSQKVDFGRDRHDEGFQPSQHHSIALTMSLFFTRYYPVVSYGGCLLSVADGDDKDGVIPSTTHLTYQNVDFFIDGSNFVLSQSRDYTSMNHSKE